MARYASNSSRTILVPLTFLAGLAFPVASAADARISEGYGKLPLQFEANQGQTHQDVRFLSRGPGYSLYLTAGEAVLVLSKPDRETKDDGRGTPGRRVAPAQAMPVAIRMGLVGATPAPLVSGLDELPGKANYFIGSAPEKWRTNVPTYAKVHYREVYPGIDLVYYGSQSQLEYDFIIAPGADPGKIALTFKGAKRLEIDAQGDLVLHLPQGAIRQLKPVIYQDVDGVRQEIAGSYVRRGANRIGFKVAAYDRSRPLVIDPVVLSYSTYLGGNSLDQVQGIAVDPGGNAYVAGWTWSTNFPTTAGAFSTTKPASVSAFVTKVNPSGTALVYSTYLGDGSGVAIAVDATGNAYVTGHAGANFPITPGAFQPSIHGFFDAFVTKLNPAGTALVYSTYLGGSMGDTGDAIAVDGTGHAYVTGSTTSTTDFPVMNAIQATHAGGGSQFPFDAFVTKLNPVGSALVYSTYLGGSGDDAGRGIAVDSTGNAYVTGTTNSVNFATTPGSLQPVFGGTRDAFVIKLGPSGSQLIYSTYLGGIGDDNGNGIATDAAGNAYITGFTNSANFPTTAGVLQPILRDTFSAFVAKLNPGGSALVYSTYLGGSGGATGNAIAVDTAGNAHVTGSTSSSDFPTTLGAFQPVLRGIDDAFVAILNSTGSALAYSTYLGGDGINASGIDIGTGIALDTTGNVYVTGYTRSANFPVTPGAFQLTMRGCLDEYTPCDAFVAKFANDTPPGGNRFEENAATYQGYWPTYGPETGTFSGGTIVASNQVTATATFTFTGTAVSWIGVKCNVCGIATVTLDGGVPTLVNTFGPGVPGSLTSEPVFSASGLARGVTHTLVITVTSTATAGLALLTGGAYIAVDAFDVTK